MTTHVVYVDSLEALNVARENMPNAHVVTDNPLLAEFSEQYDGVYNIDRLLGQEDSLRLGKAALDLAGLVDRKIQYDCLAASLGLVEDHLRIGGITSRLFSSIFYRAATMARYLTKCPRLKQVDLISAIQPDRDPHLPFLLPRFATPYPHLAKAGFFDSIIVDTHKVEVSLPHTVNETATSNVFLKAAMIPPGYLVMKLLKLSCLNVFSDKQVFVGGENEVVRETLPWLLAFGFSLRSLGKLTVPPIDVPDQQSFDETASIVTPILKNTVERNIGALSEFSHPQQLAMTDNVMNHLIAGLDSLRRLRPVIEERIDAITCDRKRPTFLITNGLFGPIGAQVYGLCRARNITVIDFEHGVTTGLSALAQEKIEYSEVASCDTLMVSSRQSKRSFEESDASRGKRIEVIGLADQTRKVRFSRLQRYLTRRRLGLKRSDVAVFHISTYAHSANVRPGYGTPTESMVVDATRALICESYEKLSHRVFFKPYPTQRFPYEPADAALFPNVKNVRFLEDEDLRYSRTAADVIVTATPTSTLGWCIGCDVPLIWLDSKITNPLLSDDLRQQFHDSFLYVDIDDSKWPSLLHDVLNREISIIRRDWFDKREARQVLTEDAIFGPSGSVGRRAANIIDGMWGNGVAA